MDDDHTYVMGNQEILYITFFLKKKKESTYFDGASEKREEKREGAGKLTLTHLPLANTVIFGRALPSQIEIFVMRLGERTDLYLLPRSHQGRCICRRCLR